MGAKHRKKRIDIEVLDRDFLFPHDVVALVKLTDEGYRQLMDKLTDLKPSEEIVLGQDKEQWGGIAFQRESATKVVGGKE